MEPDSMSLEDCRGACFTQGDDLNTYIQTGCTNIPSCVLRKCPNAHLCGENKGYPLSYLDSHQGFCQQPCSMYLGFEQFQPVEFMFFADGNCPICLKETPEAPKMKYAACGHTVCTACVAYSLKLVKKNGRFTRNRYCEDLRLLKQCPRCKSNTKLLHFTNKHE